MVEPFWMIHGVARSAAPLPEDAPPHERIPFADLIALVSGGHLDHHADPAGAEPPDPRALAREAESALMHNALLTAYAIVADVAPLRYGAAVARPDAVAPLLEPLRDRYCRILDAVAGAVEFGLQISPLPIRGSDPVDRGAGRGDTTRRVAEVAVALGAFARARRAIAPRPGRLLDLALLVPRPNAEGLIAATEKARLRAAALGLKVVLAGPWPVYSFTRLTVRTGGQEAEG